MISRIPRLLPFAICALLGSSRAVAQSLAMPPTSKVLPSSMIDPGSAWGTTVVPPTACMASLAPSDMERQAVYLDARMARGTSALLTNQADLLASDVVTTMNAMLATPNSPLASVARDIKYYSVPAELIVVARQHGAMSWRGISQSGDSGAFTLLATALDSARHRGAAVVLWPDDLNADSLVIRLSLLPGNFREAPLSNVAEKTPMRFAAFAAPMPTVTPPKLRSDLPPYNPFPNHPRSDRISGLAYVAFLVDTAGRVVPDTFHDVWPADQPRLTGTHGAYYEQLLGRVQAFVNNASYSAAKVGSCRIPFVMHVTFSFDGTISTDRYSKWD